MPIRSALNNQYQLIASPGPRDFLGPQRHVAMAWRRRQAMGTPSNWERPVTGNAQAISENAIWGGVGWGWKAIILAY